MRKRTTFTLVVVLMAGVTGLAWMMQWADEAMNRPAELGQPTAALAGSGQDRPGRHPRRADAPQRVAPTHAPLRLRPELIPGERLLGPGDHQPAVRELQARLRQIAWFSGDVSDDYGPATEEAVRGFQAKRGIAVTGYVDQRTRDRLAAMTHEPTADELANRPATPVDPVDRSVPLDPRCETGRAICIDKSSSTLRWVVDGEVRETVDVRFGASYSPTREGVFHVYWKDADHVSRLYGSAMPYSMFFSGGQAIHYSSDFAARGYAGASHGCVNVRDHDGIARLFSQVHVGDPVVIYWS